ncbi:hypothetical protein NQZ68_013995 [Dissostichus eleginoides]|nr:hypothetical protein NQZ68_013995 [Dissostichus eleginoides]
MAVLGSQADTEQRREGKQRSCTADASQSPNKMSKKAMVCVEEHSWSPYAARTRPHITGENETLCKVPTQLQDRQMAQRVPTPRGRQAHSSLLSPPSLHLPLVLSLRI